MTKLDFRISSGLKNIIGKELITDDFVAIFELVKNSYDANAKNVKIIFEKMIDLNFAVMISERPPGRLSSQKDHL